LEQREKLAWQMVLDTKTGGKAWAAAQATLNQVARQRLTLLREAGVLMQVPSQEDQNDARGLGHGRILESRSGVVLHRRRHRPDNAPSMRPSTSCQRA
jgi:hypothetical protein